MKKAKKYLGLILAAAMVLQMALPVAAAGAATKPKLSAKSVKIEVGAKKKVKVKKATGYKITVKSKKKAIATAKKKGNAAFVVTGVKAGKTKVVCTAKKGKKKVTLNCAVTVTAAAADNTTPAANNQTPANQNQANPSGNGNQGNNVNPPAEPTPEPTPFVFPEYDKYSNIPVNYDEDKEFVPKGKTESLSFTGGSATVILPAKYDESKKYPVTYLLDTDSAWVRMGAPQVIYNEIGLKMAKEMIIVIPMFDASGDDDIIKSFKDDLMPAVEGKYPVATGRVNTAVAGYDAGGRIALNIGIYSPDKVAYAGAFAPLADDNFNDGAFSVSAEYKDSTFIMIQKGSSDNTAGNAPANYNKALKDNGFECLYLEMTGGHNNDLYKGGLYNFLRRLFQRGDATDSKSNNFVSTLNQSECPVNFSGITQRGRFEKVEYDTYTYDTPNNLRVMHKYANVFLPYGYDPNDTEKKYNVFYLSHGGGENAETWLVGDNIYGDYTHNQDMVNYLFQTGYCEPCIIVNPTFYRPDGAPEPEGGAMALTSIFRDELRNDLIPAVEAKYNTYANHDVSEESLQASRMHRAFAGLSMGSATTYNSAFFGNYDIFAWFGPYSGFFGRSNTYEQDIELMESMIKEYDAKGQPLGYLYCGNGTKDGALGGQKNFMQQAVVATDVLVPGRNFDFVLIQDGEHNMWSWHVHFYNCLKVFFTKE